MTTPPDWYAADRAYQNHAAACGTCQAAGANPNHALHRCPAGAELWATYIAAGDPPHFTWVKPRGGQKK